MSSGICQLRLNEERKQWRKDHPYVRLRFPGLALLSLTVAACRDSGRVHRRTEMRSTCSSGTSEFLGKKEFVHFFVIPRFLALSAVLDAERETGADRVITDYLGRWCLQVDHDLPRRRVHRPPLPPPPADSRAAFRLPIETAKMYAQSQNPFSRRESTLELR